MTVENVTAKPKEFFEFMKTMKMGVFHNSNVFFRDIQYAISEFIRVREQRLPRYTEAEKLAKGVVEAFERENILDRIGGQAYRLNFPGFVEPPSAPKPAAPAPKTETSPVAAS